ncbi:MAG: 1-deoxy-D-xylulose-5-phosphate synthase [Planctomycetia bacterium]|nr:1-deoxy-D-xylulose-5-phosphate synthase [Planctomycetia bacterium]
MKNASSKGQPGHTEQVASHSGDLLSTVELPGYLKTASIEQLEELAREIRATICSLSEKRSIHLASNLGVVELTLALHASFDFTWDRLVWDVGHQCYPHKLLTGRYSSFETLRLRGGLSGYPNPNESVYDLFATGHAGCSVGSALGLACGDALMERVAGGDDVIEATSREKQARVRHSIAVVGDGAFSSGPIFEALNHTGGLQQKLLVILNDNKMSICRRVGGFGRYLDHLRMAPGYLGAKTHLRRLVENLPNAYAMASRFKDALKAGLIGGAFFEDLGLRYIGPIDGHDLPTLMKYFAAIKTVDQPVLLHVLTEKGRGYPPAENDPSHFHSSHPLRSSMESPAGTEGKSKTKGVNVNRKKTDSARKLSSVIGVGRHADSDDDSSREIRTPSTNENSFTFWAKQAITSALRANPRACVVVAAMTQGNMLEEVRAEFPERFFDVGICEAHAVVFAAGLAKAGMRPIVDIYSGFLQRAYDHLFQETSLQNLPIVFSLDRAGLVGSDGATHHGVFDLSYLRPFPNMTVIAPSDSYDMTQAYDFALRHNGPVAIRYPKANTGQLPTPNRAPFELGKSEIIKSGRDGYFVACGGQLAQLALKASEELARTKGLDVGVINSRFIKPLDAETILAPLKAGMPVVTLEENALAGGFGSATLEAAANSCVDVRTLVRVGVPDAFIEHGSREEQLREVGLDAPGMVKSFGIAYERQLKLTR